MAEITKEIPTALYQRSGEKLFKLLLETVAKQVVLEDGTTVQETLTATQETLEGVQETLGDVTGEQLAEAVADAHTHENKEDVLDLLGVDEDGALTFDGEPVGSGDGSGETSTRPWTAYGDGVDEAPERLRDSGIYVSDEAEAPEETAQSAVLRQKREEDLVPIYPRTSAELVSVAIEGLEATDAAGAISEVLDVANVALTKAEAGGGEAGDVAVEVAELKQQVEAQATTIASLTEQIAALQAALDAIDLSAYMPISGGQFTGAYYGTTVTADDGVIDLSKGSIYTAAVSGGTFEVTIEGAVGASCFTLALTCEEGCDVTWPASVQWPDGEAPEIVAGVNVFTFISPDAGTTWYGTVNGSDFS